MTHFTIDIVSDTVCPWCYIGWRHLTSAVEQRLKNVPRDTFSVKWHPFQLSPNTPRGHTVDKQSSYEFKYGTDGAKAIFHRIRSAGERAGINFSFRGRTGNTLDSHRLLELAGSKSKYGGANPAMDVQSKLAAELFADYFERVRDITDHSVLARAAVRAGISSGEDEILRFLASNELVEEAQAAANAAREEGHSGVPHFIINDQFTVEGAQEPIAFLHLFERLAKRERSKASL